MTDHLSTKLRSWNMSRIRSKHSKPEVLLRSLLHRAGLRFRINNKKLPGCPDIVLAKYKTAIFVHGCFWHRHKHCSRATTPSSNKDYWLQKFRKNLARDSKTKKELEKQGWKVIIIWGCNLIKNPFEALKNLISKLGLKMGRIYGINTNKTEMLKLAEKRREYLLKRGQARLQTFPDEFIKAANF